MTPSDALKRYFGYDTFRPFQEKIITTAINGQDALVIMPTGGGKSMCYQIPALVMSGTTVVVSPLIALMRDQVEGLKANGVRAEYLNSSLSSAETLQVERQFLDGELSLLYVSPEKITSQDFLPFLKRGPVNLIAIDEAHCISSWGHDFRPEYTKLRFLRQQFGHVPIIALTATADRVTRRDIVEQLDLEQPEIFIASFDRPNLFLEVRPGVKKVQQIDSFLKLRPDTAGIIYCLSRKNTEQVASKLNQLGYSAAHYHAGMEPAARSRVQDDFIADRVQIVCATIAFGMGIDKSNIRWVIHHNLPKNIEGFYQEIGRAGRDNTAADTLLFFSYADVNMMREILQKNGGNQVDVHLAKLDQMVDYAGSTVCRRRILLNYFGETNLKDCGHCDNCQNPPKQFDGTVLAQKALSAIIRTNQTVGLDLLTDILRGSGRKAIFDRGLDKIKTYGAGRHNSRDEWRSYIVQLLQQGFVESAPDKGGNLWVTDAGKKVLFDGSTVNLVQPSTIREQQEAEKAALKSKRGSRVVGVRDALFERLRSLRTTIARDTNVPPYLVFSDATLEAMAAMRPASTDDMLQVPGVGEKKLDKYGTDFLQEVMRYAREQGIVLLPGGKRTKPAYETTDTPKVSTVDQTLQLSRQGKSIEEMAEERALSTATIAAHLAKAFLNGESTELKKHLKKKDLQRIVPVVEGSEPPFSAKEVFTALNEELPYHKIRLALAYIEKKLT